MKEVLSSLRPHLAERARVLQGGSADGDLVLYWMHHAVRGHDNPALDAAVAAGNVLGLPVLVYQSLSPRLPFSSDRHHTFILEGARDARRELAERGLAHAFFLAPKRDDREPLPALAQRAALVVTEDFPAPPYPRWTRALTDRVTTPVWAVDACCLVPMQSLGRAYERAFEFRRRLSGELERRIQEPWRDVETEAEFFRGDLGFAPTALEETDVAELCARCEIDHAVGPVAHTRGGSTAGYERWRRFRDRGLRYYARRRNDAARDGVSRLSPYLHHGHVSPFRIAREAAAAGSDGARKFLDELLIWRELAHNFCFYTADPGSFVALPAWARETLRRHAGDEREAVYSWERLARGETGDELWDLAQTSLLVHGELHNNVRMTWGKALLRWTRTPEDALGLALDLNHRYALDGSDPSSYGGVLWCLGLFDRPFPPEKKVWGTVRPRSTAAHAKRLDLERYRARVTRPARSDAPTVAVIGAGISGLMAARTLRDHGLEVAVYDKARGAGGRLATRREGDYAFDHGAQYFTARDRRFRRYVSSWVEEGVAALWQGRIAALEDGRVTPKDGGPDRFVGVPRMSAVARHLASSLAVTFGARVGRVARRDGRWQLASDDGRPLGTYDAVIVTSPPAQAAELLGEAPALAERARAVELLPCWAVMAVFDRQLELPFDGAFVNDDSSPLSWVARNSSKPGRPGAESWVLHASPEWTAAHLEDDGETVTGPLVAALFEAAAAEPREPLFARAHRWRYAIARDGLDVGCLWDPELAIGACGDWCQGSRIEGAFLSGMAIAGRLLGLRGKGTADGQLDLLAAASTP